MRNLHMVEVKYLGATNTKGSRVKLTSHRFKSSITIPYSYEFNSADDIGTDWLEKNGFRPVFGGEWKNGQTIVAVEVFEPLR